MLLANQVKEVLLNNNDLRKLKSDQTIKSHCIRVINLFVNYGLCKLDSYGNITLLPFRKLETLSNFELLQLIERVISSNDEVLLDSFLAKSIQSIDYIGKCWYYPKEISEYLLKTTMQRHNYKKIKAILNRFVDEYVCLRVMNKKRQSTYRIRFTYSEVSDDVPD